MTRRPDGGAPAPTLINRALSREMSRGTFLRRAAALVLTVAAGAEVIDRASVLMNPEPPATLEKQKETLEQMSDPELAQWILDSTGDEATSDRPVRTPSDTPAYKDLKNIAAGKPAYRQTVLELDGKTVKMEVGINRDILLFRALLTTALRDPANYFEGKPILVQSGQLTNRSGSHKGIGDKSHTYGSSIDFSGAIKDGSKPDSGDNLYPYDSLINRQLGAIADMVGRVLGVQTSSKPESLERVDSLHGTPELSNGHYHYNASDESAKQHARTVRQSLQDQLEMHFETDNPVIDPKSAIISDKGRAFIHAYETFRGTTYGDAGNGHGTRTIGYGATYYLKGTVITRGGQEIVIEHDGQKPLMGDIITKDEADRLSQVAIEQEYMRPVIAALEKYGLPVVGHQFDALVSYSFHRGGSNAVKLVKRLKKLADDQHGNDALAVRAAFMYDINSDVDARFRRGVADRYLDTADIFISGSYKRENRRFDPRAWGVVIAAYFN